MIIPNFSRPSKTPATRKYVNYKERQAQKEITDRYAHETDVEVLGTKFKDIEKKREQVNKNYLKNIRGAIEGKDYETAKKTLAEEMKPVDFEQEAINARIEKIKTEQEESPLISKYINKNFE